MKLYIANQTVPARRVIGVSGSPTLKKAPKPSGVPAARVCSTTMRLATDPSSVKFPASVELIATTS